MEPIAIIGIGCRFPEANSPEAFWQLLQKGQRAIQEIPAERWEIERFYDPTPQSIGKMNTLQGGFIKGVDRFDAAFFGIGEAEARHIDPQQRLFLEVAWEALEHAGIAPLSLGGSATGVFVGLCTIDYHRLLYKNFSHIGPHSGTGTTMSITANRLSYLLDLRGPSMAIDAACSSSLVSVHLACQSLRTQESSLCVVGGVNLILSPDSMISSSQTGLLSTQGECRPFDAAADGYVRGEGCGVVVLKRLSDAIAAHDPILAVIRGSAVNQDGLSNSLTAPNGLAQQALVKKALAASGVEAKDIDYIETHAVGTLLGDAIEFKALKKVLMQDRARPCWVGSVKPNIGHLEAASGMAALIKVVLALQNEEIPAQLNFERANSYVDLEDNRFEIPIEGRSWPRRHQPRLAGMSTFGFGGTNAHLVVEEAPAVIPQPCLLQRRSIHERSHHVITLTAKTQSALRELARCYSDFLAKTICTRADSQSDRVCAQPYLPNVCFTANTGRSHFSERLAVVSHSTTQLRQQLIQFAEGEETLLASKFITGRVKGRKRPKVVFYFPAPTATLLPLGHALYQSQPIFREVLDHCGMLIGEPAEGWLWDKESHSDNLGSMDNNPLSRIKGVATAYALAKLWQSWGIVPNAVIGEGWGEYVAACIAGLLNINEVLPALVASYISSIQESNSTLSYRMPRLPLLSKKPSPLVLGAIAQLSSQPHNARENLQKLLPATGTKGYDVALEMGVTNPIRPAYRGPYTELYTDPIERLILQADVEIWPQMLTNLSRLYVKGLAVDWVAFDQGYGRDRLPIPTYPFERTSHWFTPLIETDPARHARIEQNN